MSSQAAIKGMERIYQENAPRQPTFPGMDSPSFAGGRGRKLGDRESGMT